MTDNVVALIERSQNSSHTTVIDELKRAVKAIEDGDMNPNQAVLLFLDTRDDEDYNLRVRFVDMRYSQVISALEVAKYRFLGTLAGD